MKAALALGLILAAGAGLRLYGIAQESAWYDEIVVLRNVDAPDFSTYMERNHRDDVRCPLAPGYHVTAWLWSLVFGDSTTALRLLSVTLSVASLGLVFLVGRALYGQAAGLISASALAVSLVTIYYGQEIRFYALLSPLSLLSMWGLLQLLQGGRRWWWLVHTGANAALLWTHPFTPLFFAAQGVFLLAFRWRQPRFWFFWGCAHGAMAGSYLLFLRIIHYNFLSHGQLLYTDVRPGPREFANAILVFTGTRFAKEDPAPWMPGGISLDRPIGLVFLALLAWLVWWTMRARGEKAPRAREATGLLLIWMFLPLAGLYLASMIWRPVFYYRYVFYAAPAFSILWGAALSRLPGQKTRTGVLVLVALAFAYQNLALPRPFRADYQTAMAEIQAEPHETLVVMALKHFNFWSARFNADLPEEKVVQYHGFSELCRDAAEQARHGKTVWVLFHRWARLDEFEAAMTAQGLEAERHTWAGMPPLTGFRVSVLAQQEHSH